MSLFLNTGTGPKSKICPMLITICMWSTFYFQRAWLRLNKTTRNVHMDVLMCGHSPKISFRFKIILIHFHWYYYEYDYRRNVFSKRSFSYLYNFKSFSMSKRFDKIFLKITRGQFCSFKKIKHLYHVGCCSNRTPNEEKTQSNRVQFVNTHSSGHKKESHHSIRKLLKGWLNQ